MESREIDAFSLEWWLEMQARYTREAFLIIHKGNVDWDYYEELREKAIWIGRRIIDKYGE